MLPTDPSLSLSYDDDGHVVDGRMIDRDNISLERDDSDDDDIPRRCEGNPSITEERRGAMWSGAR